MAVGTVRPASYRIEISWSPNVEDVVVSRTYLDLFAHVRSSI